MPLLEYEQKMIEVDADGCLLHFDDWDEEVAQSIAEKEGIEDTLKFIRWYYRAFDFFRS